MSADTKAEVARRIGEAVMRIIQDAQNEEQSAVAQRDGPNVIIYGPSSSSCGMIVVIAP